VAEGVLELTEVVGDWQAVAKLAEGYASGDAPQPAAEPEPTAEESQSVDLTPAEVALQAEPLEEAQPEPSAEEPETLQASAEEVPGPPPHSGAGSGAEAWRAYAHEVTDLDGTVLAEMGRAEIIALLKERDIPT
jgi:hypothetical protein